MSKYMTANGFIARDTQEIINTLNNSFQEIFGSDIDLSATSAFGQYVSILSIMIKSFWDELQESYTCRDIMMASNTCLDTIATQFNLTRLSKTATTVKNVMCYGSEGTIIEAGKLVRQSTQTINYSIDSNITISKTNARDINIIINNLGIGINYIVTINSINYSYTSILGDTKTSILNAIKTLISAGSFPGSATVSSETLYLFDEDLSFACSVSTDLTISKLGSACDITCTELGINQVPANSINTIVTPISGWDSVKNYSVGTAGRNIENDIELRARLLLSFIRGYATESAIRSGIANNVSGVNYVTVTSNRTMTTDIEGRPAKSFECVVSGGDNNNIAYEIWNKKPAGIESYGNTTVIIIDEAGLNQTIKFSRPENVYIYLRVRRNLYSEEVYPVNGNELIKSAILTWSLDNKNITIGKDLIRSRLSIPIYTIPGIKDIDIALDYSLTLPHTPTYAYSNITINNRQIAVFSTDRIIVEDI